MVLVLNGLGARGTWDLTFGAQRLSGETVPLQLISGKPFVSLVCAGSPSILLDIQHMGDAMSGTFLSAGCPPIPNNAQGPFTLLKQP
jgi:hypothetical protein